MLILLNEYLFIFTLINLDNLDKTRGCARTVIKIGLGFDEEEIYIELYIFLVIMWGTAWCPVVFLFSNAWLPF